MRIFALLLATLVFAAPAATQGIVIHTASATLDQATIGDFDFVRSTTPKWLFSLDLRAELPRTLLSNVTLEIRGDIQLSSGTGATDILQFVSRPFDIQGSRILTNLDLLRPEYRGTYSFDNDKLTDLGIRNVALSNSRLPAGVYVLNIFVMGGAPGQPREALAETRIIFDLTNPSAIELLSPPDGDTRVGRFPFFQWTYDGPASRISVYERLPGQESPEESVGGIPYLVQEIPATSFQYPTAGVRTLQPGTTYVWFVEGLARSAGGTLQSVKSTLRSFTVAKSGNIETESLLDLLERALGPKYSGLFEQIRTNEFDASGIMSLNESPITLDQFYQLVRLIQQNPNVVKSVHLE